MVNTWTVVYYTLKLTKMANTCSVVDFFNINIFVPSIFILFVPTNFRSVEEQWHKVFFQAILNTSRKLFFVFSDFKLNFRLNDTEFTNNRIKNVLSNGFHCNFFTLF